MMSQTETAAMKELALIPDVADLKRFNGEFSLTPASFIAAAPGTDAAAELLREYLSIPTGFDEIAVVPEPAAGCGGIHLREMCIRDRFDIELRGAGACIDRFEYDGVAQEKPEVRFGTQGRHRIVITMK